MRNLIFVLGLFVLLGAGCALRPSAPQMPAGGDADQGTDEQSVGQGLSVEDRLNDEAVTVYEGSQLVAVRSAQGNIFVTTPSPIDAIGNELVIRGRARVFENVVNYRVKNEAGQVVAGGYTMADAPDIGQFGPFEATVDLSSVATQTIVLEVYWESAKDGSDADLVSMVLNRN